MPCEVIVSDNFHDMNEDDDDRYSLGEFADADTALGQCRRIVDEYLASAHKPGMSSSELWDSFVSFGASPTIRSVDAAPVRFSARDYARERSAVICAAGAGHEHAAAANPGDAVERPGATGVADAPPSLHIDACLMKAYRETNYRVHGAEPFTLRVDEPSSALAAAHERMRTDCSAFITACNPFSEDAGAASNAQRHAGLGLELARRRLNHIEGIGQHPSNAWPGEASYLVFGLELESAITLGRALDQNAIIWTGADAVPRLIPLR